MLNLGMPLMEITTVNGEEPTFRGIKHPPDNNGKTITDVTKVPGRVKITIGNEVVYDSGDYEEDLSGMKIRVRGNASAWDYNPKSYKIKLEKKADLLRRGDDAKYKDKNWLLIRDLDMRCSIGFMVNSLMGLQWTPAYEHVNVYFNGSYLGLYMLTESVRRNPDCRLNVDKTGFVFEYDQYWWNEDVYVESSLGYEPLNYTFKYPNPEEITTEQLDYFKEVVGRMEQSISDGTYPEYIDIDSFVRWILGRDILGGWDGTGSNIFLTKYDNTDSSKVMMANMWDLDGIFLMNNDWDAAHKHFVFKPLLNPTHEHSKAFIDAYTQLWEQVSPTIFDTIIDRLEDFKNSKEAEALSMAWYYDLTKYEKPVRNVDYFVEVAQKWFRNRKEWLTEAIGNLKASAATGIHPAKTDSQTEQIFTLDGRPRDKVQPGLNIIHSKDGSRRKVIVR
ncbi:MAG: CotH kinase family protein [Prevotella sp.]|nr:CotH kinase family protein [Prevotella sp.]